ncbi:MAG: translation elongation factor Ts [Bacilli bacterium]|nr:translation elongation factor Ts [Bacilli bacterium]
MAATIELIKKLRERTNAGLNDCKKALEANNCDLDKACDWLREQGITKSAKKANRIAAEGLADVNANNNEAVVLEVNCETDFVAKGEKFKKLVSDTRDYLLKNKPANVEAATQGLTSIYADATVAMGEKLSLRRYEIVNKNANECFGTYIHMGGKIAVLVVINKDDKELAENLAMHIAANNPTYICPHCVPKEVLENEKKIALEAAKSDQKLMSKPQAIIDKIIEGKVHKTLSEVILHEQAYLLDDTKKVEQVLKEKGAAVIKFIRYQVGEGIEKRVDDFVNEVMSQAK